jgi:hypothetical protein
MLSCVQTKPLQGLVSWITIGTPFFQFAPERVRYLGLVPGMLAAAGLVFSLYAGTEIWHHFTEMYIGTAIAVSIALAFLFTILAFAATVGFRDLVIALRAQRAAKVRKNAAAAALAVYGAKWVPIWSEMDEAINGLRSTLAEPVSTASETSATYAGFGGVIRRQVGSLYNQLISGPTNAFIWNRITRKLQGSDIDGEQLEAVHRAPAPVATERPPLPDSVERDLVLWSNRHASEILAEARNALGLLAQSGGRFGSFITLLRGRLSWNELVHTSYLKFPAVRDLLAGHLSSPSKQTTYRWDNSLACSASLPERAAFFRSATPQSRLGIYKAAALSTSAVLLSGVIILLEQQSIDPYTHSFQRKQLVRIAKPTVALVEDGVTADDVRHKIVYNWYGAVALALAIPTDASIQNAARSLAKLGDPEHAHDEERSHEFYIKAAIAKNLMDAGRQSDAREVISRAMSVASKEDYEYSRTDMITTLAPIAAHAAMPVSTLEGLLKIAGARESYDSRGVIDPFLHEEMTVYGVDVVKSFLELMSDESEKSQSTRELLTAEFRSGATKWPTALDKYLLPWDRAAAKAELARNLTIAGRYNEAKQLWTGALEDVHASSEYQNPNEEAARNGVLWRIAGSLASVGMTERAIETLHGITGSFWASDAFYGGELAVYGLIKLNRLSDAVLALKNFHIVTDESTGAEGIYRIPDVTILLAQAIRKAGKTGEERALWNSLISSSRETEDAQQRSAAIADGIRRSGDFAFADSIWQQTVQTVFNHAGEAAYTELTAMARNTDYAPWLRTLSRQADRIYDIRYRSNFLTALAISLAHADALYEAHHAAEEISYPSMQLQSYTQILLKASNVDTQHAALDPESNPALN